MKAIVESVSKLPESAAKLAAAMAKAGETVTVESAALVKKLGETASSFAVGLKEVAKKITQLPALLNPAPIVNCCSENLEQAFKDLKEIGSESVKVPDPLVASVKGFKDFVPEIQGAVKNLEKMPDRLADCVPKMDWLADAKNTFISVPNDCKSILVSARGSVNGSYKQLGSAVTGWTKLSPVEKSSLDTVRTDAVAQVDSAHQGVTALIQSTKSQCESMKQAIHDVSDGVKNDIQSSQDSVFETIDATLADLMAPVNSVIKQARSLQSSVRESSTQGTDTLDLMGEKVRTNLENIAEPVALLKSQLNDVVERLREAATELENTLSLAVQPFDDLQVSLDNVGQSLDDVVLAFEELVADVVAVLDDLTALITRTQETLKQFPQEIEKVRDTLNDVISHIEEIRARIPEFVSQALAALDATSAQLDEAALLCNDAIALCTKYQLKVPKLMFARMLFMGLKSSLTPIKGSIAAAKVTVKAAGKTADGLVGQALSAAKLLNGAIDQAKKMIEAAVDTMVEALDVLKDQIANVKKGVESLPPLIQDQLDTVKQKLSELVAQAKKVAEDAVNTIKLEPTLDAMQTQLDAMCQKILDAIAASTESASDGVEGILKRIGDAIASMTAQFDTLADGTISQLEGVEPFIQGKADALKEMVTTVTGSAIDWLDKGQGMADGVFDTAITQLDNTQSAWDSYCDKCRLALGGAASEDAPEEGSADESLSDPDELTLEVWSEVDVA